MKINFDNHCLLSKIKTKIEIIQKIWNKLNTNQDKKVLLYKNYILALFCYLFDTCVVPITSNWLVSIMIISLIGVILLAIIRRLKW